MTKSVRKLKGWPPTTGPIDPVRPEDQRADAATVLNAMLNDDSQLEDHKYGRALTTRQRWAMHVAIGVLTSRRS